MFSVLASLAVSVPKRYPGFVWGPEDAPIAIEVFCDPLCSDCRDTWPRIQSVLGRYPTQVSVRVHLLNLPYHTWAYYSVIATYALNSTILAKQFIDGLYSANEQAKFSNTALANVPEAQIPAAFADFVAGKFGISKEAYLANFGNAAVRSAAGATFGWAAAHLVDGTPTVLFNGALTSLGAESSLSNWTSIIDSLLN
jgi:protein-disulfide isomerase